MNKLIGVIVLAMAAAAPLAQAADDTPTKGNSKMADCNKQSAGKTGDDRKAFMSACMSTKPAPAKPESKMSACNKQSAGKTGDDRKAFMSSCMSGKSAT